MRVRRITAVSLSIVALPLLLSSTGCSALDPVIGGGNTSAVYRSTDDFVDAAKTAGITVPAWVTPDATTIRITYRSTGAILMTTPASSLDECSDNGTAAEAPFIDSWWPLTPPDTAKDCTGEWVVFTDGSSSYGYTTASITG
ncbi:MAG: hypothetical protein ACTJHU_05660 [Mycetocola sp.]